MRAILSLTSSGDIKSKIVNKEMSVLSFDVYITPKEFGDIIEKYEGKDFELKIE